MAMMLFVVYAKVQTYLEQKRMIEEYTSLNLAANEEDASRRGKKRRNHWDG